MLRVLEAATATELRFKIISIKILSNPNSQSNFQIQTISEFSTLLTTTFIYHNLPRCFNLQWYHGIILMSLGYFISASPCAGTLFTFPETCGASAVSSIRLWASLLGFNQQSFFPSLGHIHIVTSVTDLVCSHTKCNGQKASLSFWFHQYMFSYSLQSVIELFWTSLTPEPHIFCFQICHFILCISQIQYSFSFLIATNICILSQQYLLHPLLHYHFNQVPSIHTLMRSFSSPVIFSIWVFSYIPLHLSIS